MLCWKHSPPVWKFPFPLTPPLSLRRTSNFEGKKSHFLALFSFFIASKVKHCKYILKPDSTFLSAMLCETMCFYLFDCWLLPMTFVVSQWPRFLLKNSCNTMPSKSKSTRWTHWVFFPRGAQLFWWRQETLSGCHSSVGHLASGGVGGNLKSSHSLVGSWTTSDSLAPTRWFKKRTFSLGSLPNVPQLSCQEPSKSWECTQN